MKRLFALLVVLATLSTPALAQKFAFVDTEKILEKMDEYKTAQQELEAITKEWQAEIDGRYAEVDKLYSKFQQEQWLLDEDTKLVRIEAIEEKERAAKALQEKRFGFEGDLFKKRQELIGPIQDKVYDAITELAKKKYYDFIFDKASGGSYMLYANPDKDESETILRALGY